MLACVAKPASGLFLFMTEKNPMKAAETAVVLIEFQNDYCKEEGALYALVEDELVRPEQVHQHPTR